MTCIDEKKCPYMIGYFVGTETVIAQKGFDVLWFAVNHRLTWESTCKSNMVRIYTKPYVECRESVFDEQIKAFWIKLGFVYMQKLMINFDTCGYPQTTEIIENSARPWYFDIFYSIKNCQSIIICPSLGASNVVEFSRSRNIIYDKCIGN